MEPCGVAVLLALATAGSRTTPVPPSTTAAPAAAMDVRIFMEHLRVSGAPDLGSPGLMGVLGPAGHAVAERSHYVIGCGWPAARTPVRVVPPAPGRLAVICTFYLGTGDS